MQKNDDRLRLFQKKTFLRMQMIKESRKHLSMRRAKMMKSERSSETNREKFWPLQEPQATATRCGKSASTRLKQEKDTLQRWFQGWLLKSGNSAGFLITGRHYRILLRKTLPCALDFCRHFASSEQLKRIAEKILCFFSNAVLRRVIKAKIHKLIVCF